MGIEKFFTTIKNNKEISEEVILNNLTVNSETVYIDFNALLIDTIDEIEQELNYILYDLIINNRDNCSELIFNKYNKYCKLSNLEDFNKLDKKIVLSNILKKNINFLISSNCKYLYISVDGIPTMAKIVEQRRRKYTNYIFDKMKNSYCDKFKDSFDEHRKIFELNRININKNIINNYETFIRENINCEQIIFSGCEDRGEGEHKIFIDIYERNNHNNYLIYSPDADVIILSLILSNKFNNINSLVIAKQREENILFIDILKLKENIINYVNKKVNKKYNNLIIQDICLLISFLGNDFIPKQLCFKSKDNITIILDTYCDYLKNNSYITYNQNYDVKINYNNLVTIISYFTRIENKLLYERYCVNNYKNTGYLSYLLNQNSSISNNSLLVDKISNYVNNYNEIVNLIKNNKDKNFIIDNINNLGEVFIKQLLLIEDKDISDNYTNQLDLFIDKLIKDISEQKYTNKLRLYKNSTNINDKFHQKNILLQNYHHKMIINDYDKEIYKFENRLENYNNILDYNNIGYFNIISSDNYYKINVDNITQNKNKYYRTHNIFNIRDICKEYISGLFFTFDLYFNKLKKLNVVSIWSYKYSITPLLKDIDEFLKKLSDRTLYLSKIFSSITNTNSHFYIKQDKFMNSLEHNIYISPYKIENDKYKRIYEEKYIFIDFNKIINSVLLNPYKFIYCDQGEYLSKSIIKNLNHVSYNDYYKLVIGLRN